MTSGRERAFSRVWLVWQEGPAYRKLPARALRVLTALAQFQEGSCLPTRVTVSYRWISEATGLGKPDISRAVKALSEAGFIRKLWSSGRGTCYELTCPACGNEGAGAGDNPVGACGNPEVVYRGNARVAFGNNPEVGGCRQPIKNPPIREINNPNQQGEAPADPEGFAELWRLWPNRNGSRAQASAVFARLLEAGIRPRLLISIAEEFKRGFDADFRYFPQLARWLDPDDVGGWCELFREKRARRRSALLEDATEDDLWEALERIDARFHDLRQRAREDPRGSVDGYYDNQTVAQSYFIRHQAEARDELTREALEADGLIDIALLPAVNDYDGS